MSDIKSYFAKNQATAHENFLHSDGVAKAAGDVAEGAGKAASNADLIGQAVKLAGDITVGVYSTKQQIHHKCYKLRQQTFSKQPRQH